MITRASAMTPCSRPIASGSVTRQSRCSSPLRSRASAIGGVAGALTRMISPVGLGAGVGPLVRQDDPARVLGHLAQRDDAAPGDGPVARAVGLLVGVDRRRVLLDPDALGEPAV